MHPTSKTGRTPSTTLRSGLGQCLGLTLAAGTLAALAACSAFQRSSVSSNAVSVETAAGGQTDAGWSTSTPNATSAQPNGSVANAASGNGAVMPGGNRAPARRETFYASEPVDIAYANQNRPATGATAQADTQWAQSQSGWAMISTSALAEQNRPQTPANGFSNGNGSTTPLAAWANGGGSATNQNSAGAIPLTGNSAYDRVLNSTLPTERSPDQQRYTTENVRQVTFATVGAEFDPQLSRDGKWMVFASTQHRDTADIYIRPVDSKTLTRLTSDPAQDVMPVLSPDGQYVAFSSNRNGNWDIFVMPTTGGQAVQLTNDPAHDLHASWSPDGTRLVFSRLGQASGRWELWVLDLGQPDTAQFVGYGLFPEWCPTPGTGMNGADRIVFQRSRERGDRSFAVWTLDYLDSPARAGRETEIVSSPTEALINPTWSPDGEFILYAAVPNGQSTAFTVNGEPEKSALWMIGNDGRGQVKLVGGATIDLMPVWGADNRVFFVSNRSGVENLWSVDVGGAVQTASLQRPKSAAPKAGETAFTQAPSE